MKNKKLYDDLIDAIINQANDNSPENVQQTILKAFDLAINTPGAIDPEEFLKNIFADVEQIH
tara:strand:+ start:928 stop:1113 length:186 start_codon:yes stop_codon:yes gene_type:complete